ncbi:MAG: LysM peptidoglycan-binding domain-containing protein [Alistipes sp.]
MNRFCLIILLLVGGMGAFAIEKSQTVVYINGAKYYLHTVQAGETLYALSKSYQVGESVIVEHNPSAAKGLKTDENIKIPCVTEAVEVVSEKKLKRTFDTHTIAKGETLYGISRRYSIPIRTILEDNPDIDPTHLQLSGTILIRKKQIGSESKEEAQAQWAQYRDQLNSVAPAGDSYHIVQPGETFYSIARRFSLTEATLSEMNNGLQPADLKAESIIKVSSQTQLLAATKAADSAALAASVAEETAKKITFRALSKESILHISLLLPLTINDLSNNNYLEFYQGFLLGLDSVKLQGGYSMNLTLFNTEHDLNKVKELINSPEFQQSDLIVGPIYEDVLAPIIEFAEKRAIPVVSPLANMAATNSEVLFQLAPNPETKYEKLADLIDPTKHITLIYTTSTDEEFEQEILALLKGKEYSQFNYNSDHPAVTPHKVGSLSSLMTGDQDQTVIILADNEIDVERVLATLASTQTNLSSRGRTLSQLTVLGNAHWNRYNNLDRAVFFKNNIVFSSMYHAKRNVKVVRDFDQKYIRAFQSLPTLYSYRGYDTAAIFCTAMYDDIATNMEDTEYTPLQTVYLFKQTKGQKSHINQNWNRVNYNNEFTIVTE